MYENKMKCVNREFLMYFVSFRYYSKSLQIFLTNEITGVYKTMNK